MHIFREAELYPSFKHFKTVLFSEAQPFPSVRHFYITMMALVDLDKLQLLCVKEALSPISYTLLISPVTFCETDTTMQQINT